MELFVLQEELKKVLDVISKFILSNPQLPILSMVLLKAKQGKFFISGTNLEVGVTTIIGANIKNEGTITTPFRTFQELVSSLTPGRIEIKSEKETLFLVSNNYSVNLMTLPPNDFPVLVTSIPKGSITIETKTLEEIAQKLTFATGNNETKAVYSGVLFAPKENNVDIVATDGVRLAKKTLKNLKLHEKVILPAKVVSELYRIFDNENEVAVSYQKEENRVIFGNRKVVLSTHTIEGDFPDFEKVIPTTFATNITVDREDLLRAVQIASIFASDYKIELQVSKNGINLISSHPQFGSQNSNIEAKVEGEDMVIAFNWRFVREFLNATTSETIIMKLTGPASPALFSDPTDPEFVYVVMPIRISEASN